MMKFLYVIPLLLTLNTFANEPKIVSSASMDLVDSNKKLSLYNGTVPSTGKIFLENYVRNTYENVKELKVTELYSVNLSSEWTGAIFDIDVVYLNNTISKKIKKIFYNETLAVEEIYNSKAIPMSRLLNLPLVSQTLAYNKDFLIREKTSTPIENNANNQNMVIFGYTDCTTCKLNMERVVNYGIANDMNIYFYAIAGRGKLSIFKSKLINAYIRRSNEEEKRLSNIEMIKKVYKYNFLADDEVSLLREFNDLVNTNITIDEVENILLNDLTESISGVAEKLYIREDFFLYIDGKLIKKYGEL
ncbi:hypothetical protein [Poseidonibacter ostreae]|uniref:Thioredoxin-like fold domain-containing protein n=1 Tax=Poseidonibacter ostreae TaxID=2654171 RepID=A0A6L4WWN2_9BACT|nr:hypothetical protein [Poseidonibacter ostreae]KAB7891267.1 hypothetical protein GBG19_00090 [Poseidonibacter ostreae]